MKKAILITGASSGIGLEFARVFAAETNNLVLVARSEEKLKELADELTIKYGVGVKVIKADLSKMSEVQKVYDTCKAAKIEIDFLVNNAGFGTFGFFAETDWEKTEQMIDLNIKSLTKMCRMFIPDMITRKSGKILNVASTAAFQPGPTMAVYFATKSFVLFLSEALYNELRGTGVSVTCLCPGATESDFHKTGNVSESNLFRDKKLPSSAEVARFGYDALMKNKMTVIHGLLNTIMAKSARFVPRKLLLTMARQINGNL